MPRKRRKSMLEKKPSLIFTESPVHVQKNIPSPVHCALHPPTADAVNIEDMQSLTWVSPQFHQGCSQIPRKTRLRRRQSIACHAALHLRNEDDTALKQSANHLRKYQSLKFLRDRSISTLAEDVDCSIDSGTASENENDNNKNPRLNYQTRNHAASGETASFYKHTRIRTRNTEGNIGVMNYHPEQENQIPCNGLSYENSVSTVDTNGSSDIRKAPVRRLYASQLQNVAKYITAPVDICSDDGNKGSRVEGTCFVETAETNRRSHTEIFPEVEETSEKEFQGHRQALSRPVRTRQHLQYTLLATDSTPHSTQKTVHVLAPDTPETQYGWSIRERQLSRRNRDTADLPAQKALQLDAL